MPADGCGKGAIDAARREETCDAFRNLARDLGMREDRAQDLLDEWRDFLDSRPALTIAAIAARVSDRPRYGSGVCSRRGQFGITT
jgi:hypothetical protein